MIGFVSDRLKTRWGRRKPFILVGTPIYAAGIWLLFVPPITFSEVQFLGLTFNSGYPYLFLMVTLVYLGSTIKDLPYVAWGAELSQNYNERTLITSWREGFAVAGSLLSAFTPAILLFAGYVKPTDAVYFLSVAMCIVMPVLVLNALLVVPEHPVLSRPQKMPLKESLKVVLQNEPYVLLIVIFVFSTLGSAMTNSLSFFFVKHVLLAGDLYGLYLAPYFLSNSGNTHLVWIVPTHWQASGNHVCYWLVCALVLFYPVNRTRPRELVYRLRDSPSAVILA